jgi:Ca-activated chloride channel family protein
VALSPTPVTEKATIERVINGLGAAGSTAGGSGIQLAYDQARAGFVEGGINHIVMCTDGDFNVGISDTNALLDLIEMERTSGITLTTLGFGSGNLNDEMMEKVTNAGNGMYSVISSEDQAIAYANERMLATFAEILKHSPYADPEELETIETIVQSDPEVKSGPHAEFATLFARARSMIEEAPAPRN